MPRMRAHMSMGMDEYYRVWLIVPARWPYSSFRWPVRLSNTVFRAGPMLITVLDPGSTCVLHKGVGSTSTTTDAPQSLPQEMP